MSRFISIHNMMINVDHIVRILEQDEDTRIMAAGYIFSEGKRLEKLSFKLLELLLLKKEANFRSLLFKYYLYLISL